MNPIELSEDESTLLGKIAESDGISERRALHDAIYFLASKVDYTKNIEQRPSEIPNAKSA